MAKPQIEPRILKGFRDLLPSEAQTRINLFETIRKVFQDSCYLPIDTPALEYSEILLGKGSDESDKQMFRFKDQGDRDVALRFDLTIPLARFASQHRNDLTFPFRRYHIAPVWRAEKPQKGRYREFYQCDFDIIGTKDVKADIETLIVISRIFEKVGLRYKIRVNHRGVLNSLISQFAGSVNPTFVLRAIDKLEKLGKEKVLLELETEAGLNKEKAESLLSLLLELKQESDPFKSVKLLKEKLETSTLLDTTLKNLEVLFDSLQTTTLKNGSYVYDISIARGLDYYTGIVYETQLLEYPDLGSVCSGGRYDDLASLFSPHPLPGVGSSVGIDRLLVAIEDAKLNLNQDLNKKVLVTVFSKDLTTESFKLANELREASFKCEVFPDDSKMGNQMKYADKNNFDFALVLGPDELLNKKVVIKNLKTSEVQNQTILDRADLINFLQKHLS